MPSTPRPGLPEPSGQGGEYILAVKDNQGHLYEDIMDLFGDDRAYGFQDAPYHHAKQVNKGHGRLEIRECWSISDPEYLAQIRDLDQWERGPNPGPDLLRATHRGPSGNPGALFHLQLGNNAERILQAKRSYWGIENGLHWVLDLAFNEDRSRVRKDHAPENLALMRQMAVNLLKQEQSVKVGIKAKRMKCGWDTDYLLKVLAG